MALDLTKPVQTRDGRPVRILATDRSFYFPVVALVKTTAREDVQSYTAEGLYREDGVKSPLDLVQVPEETTVYVNFYRGYLSGPLSSMSFGSREMAAANANGGSFRATFKATLHDGVPVKFERV